MRLLRLAYILTAVIALISAQGSADAQRNLFPDVPTNHWAYTAVNELESKGYISGYPDGTFSGGTTLTRFEFATVIDRLLDTVASIEAQSVKSHLPAVTPTGAAVTQDDLNKIQVLADTFQSELTAIQADVSGLDNELNDLRQDLQSAKAAGTGALVSAGQAQKSADFSYGNAITRKFSITGYVQTRYEGADSGNQSVFTKGQNTGAGAGGIAAAVNGTYAEGGASASAEVRRARLYIEGSPTQNTSYQMQIDASGAVNSYSAANQQVIVIQAFGTYKFGDGSPVYPTLSAGLLLNPFGYAVNVYPAALITPERPLAFQLTTNVGLWDAQDTDKGLSLAYGPKQVKFTYALLNGSGRLAENIQGHFDSVARIAYTAPGKHLNLGVSYYSGRISRGRSTGDGDAAITTDSYDEPKKDLYGLDAQTNYKGFFANYEFVRGTYEKRSYFDEDLATPGTNPLGFETDNYVKGNQVQGSYIIGGYTFHSTSPRPLSLAFDYDTFLRSISSQSNSANALQSSIPSGLTGYRNQYFGSGSSWDDINLGGGVLYNLDRATRFRLWYDKPFAVAHAPGTPEPPKIGLYTAEMQFRF